MGVHPISAAAITLVTQLHLWLLSEDIWRRPPCRKLAPNRLRCMARGFRALLTAYRECQHGVLMIETLHLKIW